MMYIRLSNSGNGNTGSDLSNNMWAVIGRDGVMVIGLKHTTAHEYVNTLMKISAEAGNEDAGLCVVTDAAAARYNKKI